MAIKRSTWILLGVFVVLGGFAIYMAKSPLQLFKETPTPTSYPTLLGGWSGLNIVKIDVSSSTGTDFVVEKISDSTWVFSDGDGVVDQGKIQQLLTSIVTLKVLNITDPGVSLENLGLTSPSEIITVSNSSGEQLSIAIGGVSPTASGYYVQIDNNTPVMVGKYAIEDLMMSLTKDSLSLVMSTPTP